MAFELRKSAAPTLDVRQKCRALLTMGVVSAELLLGCMRSHKRPATVVRGGGCDDRPPGGASFMP